MISMSPGWLPISLILMLFLLFGLMGGSMAKKDNRPFWVGFAIGVFGNIAGLLILAYITNYAKKRTFEPNFDRTKVSAIKHLAQLNKEGKLSDQEFERMKKEIIKESN